MKAYIECRQQKKFVLQTFKTYYIFSSQITAKYMSHCLMLQWGGGRHKNTVEFAKRRCSFQWTVNRYK